MESWGKRVRQGEAEEKRYLSRRRYLLLLSLSFTSTSTIQTQEKYMHVTRTPMERDIVIVRSSKAKEVYIPSTPYIALYPYSTLHLYISTSHLSTRLYGSLRSTRHHSPRPLRQHRSLGSLHIIMYITRLLHCLAALGGGNCG